MKTIKILTQDKVIENELNKLNRYEVFEGQIDLPFGATILTEKEKQGAILLLHTDSSIDSKALLLDGEFRAVTPDVFSAEVHSPRYVAYQVPAGVRLTAYEGRICEGTCKCIFTFLHPHPIN